MLKINNMIMVFLLLSVFAVGTLSFADTVNATVKSVDENKEYSIESKEKSAKWKKYKTGWVKYNKTGYKGFASYTSYIKGSKDIKMQIHAYKNKNNKKTLVTTFYLSKTGKNQVKSYTVSPKGKKSKPGYDLYKGSIKLFHDFIIASMNYG